MARIANIVMRIVKVLNTSQGLGLSLLVQVQMSNVLAMVGTEQNIEVEGMRMDVVL